MSPPMINSLSMVIYILLKRQLDHVIVKCARELTKFPSYIIRGVEGGCFLNRYQR